MGSSSRRNGFGLYHVLILLLFGSVVGVFAYPKWTGFRADQKRLAVARAVIADLDKITVVARDWGEAREVAGATSRIALSGPVQRLQEVRRKIDGGGFAGCAESVRGSFRIAMDAGIDGFLKFMHQDAAGSSAALTMSGVAEVKAASEASRCRAEQEGLIKRNGKVTKQ